VCLRILEELHEKTIGLAGKTTVLLALLWSLCVSASFALILRRVTYCHCSTCCFYY